MENRHILAKRIAKLQNEKSMLEKKLDKSYEFEGGTESMALESKYVRLLMKIDALMHKRMQLL